MKAANLVAPLRRSPESSGPICKHCNGSGKNPTPTNCASAAAAAGTNPGNEFHGAAAGP